MLPQTLRGLEHDGLVLRTVTATRPPRVDYGLTPVGMSLREPLKAIEEWAKAHMSEVPATQGTYDGAP